MFLIQNNRNMTSHIYDTLSNSRPKLTYSSGSVDLSMCVHKYIGCCYDKSDGKVILMFDVTLNNSIRIRKVPYYKAGQKVLMYVKCCDNGIIEYFFSAPPHDTNWVSFSIMDRTIYASYYELIKFIK